MMFSSISKDYQSRSPCGCGIPPAIRSQGGAFPDVQKRDWFDWEGLYHHTRMFLVVLKARTVPELQPLQLDSKL